MPTQLLHQAQGSLWTDSQLAEVRTVFAAGNSPDPQIYEQKKQIIVTLHTHICNKIMRENSVVIDISSENGKEYYGCGNHLTYFCKCVGYVPPAFLVHQGYFWDKGSFLSQSISFVCLTGFLPLDLGCVV